MERLSSFVTNLASRGSSTLQVTDNRTGQSYTIPISPANFIDATELSKIVDINKEPLRSYDPGYLNTVNCTSAITFIDGDKGILQYRGIPIEQLAQKSDFLEVAYLLIEGNLPSIN